MTGWIVYLLFAGALVAVAVAAADAACRTARWPRRFAPFAGLLFIVALAIIAPENVRVPAPSSGDAVPGFPVTYSGDVSSLAASTRGTPRLSTVVQGIDTFMQSLPSLLTSALPRLDALYIGTWIATSVVLLLLFLGVHVRFLHARRGWPRMQLHGADVCVSPKAGPAVVGAFRPDIVVPRWLLDRTNEEQRLVVTHEREHIRVGDPLMLATAWSCAVAMPWHPAAWWLLWHVRLAVELDCDARVISRGAERQSYGSLLIELSQQTSGLPVSATALSDRATQLERRLIAMNVKRPSFFMLRSASFALAAFVLVLSACALRKPPESENRTVLIPEVDMQTVLIAERVDFVDPDPVVIDRKPVVIDSRSTHVIDIVPRVVEVKPLVIEMKPLVVDVKPVVTVIDSQARPPAGTTQVDVSRPLIIIDGVIQLQSPAAGTDTTRRSNSIVQDRRPLVVLDGVVLRPDSAADIFRILPLDRIESVEVVRGQAATDRYGERARDGVLYIITRGSSTPPFGRGGRGGRGGDGAGGSGANFVFSDTTVRGDTLLKIRPPTSGVPLIIVDGVIQMGDAAAAIVAGTLPRNQIESIEIVRGAAAIALYGERAANGVINIKTKRRGGGGGPRQEFSMGGIQQGERLKGS